MPAATLVDAPADAPADLKISGKFTTGRRVESVGSVMGKSADRPTGISVPFKGQPIQGQSGVKVMPDGTFWVLTDNGFGSKANSPDAMLFLNHYRVDWETGTFNRQATIFLHDPDKKVPQRIVHEDTAKRYLTGSDFDTEGFQWIGDTLWIGDEFGPAGFSRQVQHLMFSRNASAGVLYPRHFLGVELTAHVISSISRAV